ncbi:MAG: flagellin [Sedimentisphaerales bacterium]
MLAIKNNIMAVNAARYLGVSYEALAQSVERLSSGLRINTAKDDAAGLAVRELMRADIAVLQQGARNAQDGISLVQVAEGGMQTIDDLLVRMKQLAEQAATGVYSSAQRAIMDNEFDELADEIERIAGAAEFNGISLLNSASGTVSVVFGGSSDAITIDMVDMTKSGLGIDVLNINTAASAQAALSGLDSAINTANTARADFGAKMNRLENVVGVVNVQAENLMAAESRISDVDVATEMSALTRNQVLTQAGVAMLAQANVLPQMALTLLR